MSSILVTIFMLVSLSLSTVASASDSAPWGTAEAATYDYEPQKVLYDLVTGNREELSNILDRVSYLFKLYGSDPFDSSIVVIIHGDAIPFFSTGTGADLELMRRAYSATIGAPIEFRLCQAAARQMGYEPEDFHGFVSMVPMADAEIVKLQNEGYAYMQ